MGEDSHAPEVIDLTDKTPVNTSNHGIPAVFGRSDLWEDTIMWEDSHAPGFWSERSLPFSDTRPAPSQKVIDRWAKESKIRQAVRPPQEYDSAVIPSSSTPTGRNRYIAVHRSPYPPPSS
jgi:hypothetical protein